MKGVGMVRNKFYLPKKIITRLELFKVFTTNYK
jgi:hypothetical protein